MTIVNLSDEAAQALDEIMKRRGLSSPGEALLEAIGTEKRIAEELDEGGRILVEKKSKEIRELVFDKG